MTTLSAGIVVYRPDWDHLRDLVRVLSRTADSVSLFQNSALEADQIATLRDEAGASVTFLGDGTNVGLGTAYNVMIERARRHGVRWFILFDQDSLPRPDFVPALRNAMDRLHAAGERPAVVGPFVIDPGGSEHKQPRRFVRRSTSASDDLVPVEFVISSGSLLDLEAAAAVGPFRDDFFIDAVDIEWCFRAWARGRSCWMAREARMSHQLGSGVIKVPGFGMRLALQPPARVYTYVRNQTYMLGLRHVPLRWKARVLPYMLVQGGVFFAATGGDRRFLKAVAKGLVDGARARLGGIRPVT